MTVFKYALMRGVKTPASMIINLVLPLFLVIIDFDMEIFGADAQYRGLFIVAMLILYGGFMMARGIQADKMNGVIIRILAGPVTMRSYLVQNFFSAMVPMTVLSALIGAVGFILHSWEIQFALALVLVYIILAASSIGLSFVWSCIFKDQEASTAIFSVLITGVAMIGGLFLPLAILPRPLWLFGALFPAHWAARAMETFMDYGMNGEYWLSLLAMILFTVAFLLYGSKRRLV